MCRRVQGRLGGTSPGAGRILAAGLHLFGAAVAAGRLLVSIGPRPMAQAPHWPARGTNQPSDPVLRPAGLFVGRAELEAAGGWTKFTAELNRASPGGVSSGTRTARTGPTPLPVAPADPAARAPSHRHVRGELVAGRRLPVAARSAGATGRVGPRGLGVPGQGHPRATGRATPTRARPVHGSARWARRSTPTSWRDTRSAAAGRAIAAVTRACRVASARGRR